MFKSFFVGDNGADLLAHIRIFEINLQKRKKYVIIKINKI